MTDNSTSSTDCVWILQYLFEVGTLVVGVLGVSILLWRTILTDRDISNRHKDEMRKYYTERYTMGLEYLHDENVKRHEVGSGILRNLAKSEIVSPDQLKDIATVMNRYLQANSSPENISNNPFVRFAFWDILWAISEIDNKVKLDRSTLSFDQLNFSHIKFNGIKLNDISVKSSNFKNSWFNPARDDEYSELVNIDFSDSNLDKTQFHLADLTGSKFVNCRMESVVMMDANVGCCDFSGSVFSNNPFTETANSEFIIYHQDNPPIIKGKPIEDLPESRAYETPITREQVSGHLPGTPMPTIVRKFVKSDEDWSGKDVDDWIKHESQQLYFPVRDDKKK